tara:strand:+ start:1482 stop:1658 length:177 start_codon:yes stop_codon:yes gene_type:complete
MVDEDVVHRQGRGEMKYDVLKEIHKLKVTIRSNKWDTDRQKLKMVRTLITLETELHKL